MSFELGGGYLSTFRRIVMPSPSGSRLKHSYPPQHCSLSCIVCIVVSCLVCIVVVVLCILLSSYVYLLYCVCIAVFNLDARLLARSQYSEGPATGHLDTGFSWFPSVYKQTLRWFPRFQVATTSFSCSPPDLNSVVTNLMFCIHVK